MSGGRHAKTLAAFCFIILCVPKTTVPLLAWFICPHKYHGGREGEDFKEQPQELHLETSASISLNKIVLLSYPFLWVRWEICFFSWTYCHPKQISNLQVKTTEWNCISNKQDLSQHVFWNSSHVPHDYIYVTTSLSLLGDFLRYTFQCINSFFAYF